MLKIIITSDNLHLPLFHDMMVVDLVHLMNHIMLCIYIIIIKTSILSQSCLVRMKFLIYLFLFISLKYFQTRKAPGALDPAVVLHPPPLGGGVKYVTVTQDKSPCLCSERHDQYLFGRAKSGGLGQVTTKKKKKTTEKK